MHKYASMIAAGALLLTGCASFENQSPQDQLREAELTFGAAVAVYDHICAGAKHPAACDDPKAQASEIAVKNVAVAAFAAAQASIDTGKPDQAAVIAAALQSVAAMVTLATALQSS